MAVVAVGTAGTAVGAAVVAAGAQAASSSVQITTKFKTLKLFTFSSPLTNLAKKIEALRGFGGPLRFAAFSTRVLG
jgi:hypothetical protein